MTYAAVGSSFGANATPLTSFSLTTSTIGDFILAEVSNHGTALPASLSSTHVTWSLLGNPFATVTNAGRNLQCFLGIVTSAATATVTIGVSPGTTGATIAAGQEFSSTTGNPVLDVQGGLDQTTGTTWVSLTPATPGELYFGVAANSSSAISGTTSGYIYNNNVDGQHNGMAYNVNCAANVATAPVWGDTGQQFGIMILMKPSPAPGSPLTRQMPNLPSYQVFSAGRMGAGHSV